MKQRFDWKKEEIKNLYEMPLLELIFRAATIHRNFHKPNEIQVCSLISVKTGGCPENCKYCSQSVYYQTGIKATPLMSQEAIISNAKRAVENGATRVCLGAAWRSVRESPQFDQILAAVSEISKMGVEVCCTLGMLSESQAKRLKEAGLYAYNHNLDTSREYYSQVTTTRRYDDRLDTLDAVQKAGLSVCCGGIIGMGESVDDRVSLLHTLATRKPHPDSVPINFLIPVDGTPHGKREILPIWDMVRMIATARLTMPHSIIRLSAGRLNRSKEEQALCFLAGANSIFAGEKLLTQPNPHLDADREMMQLFGLSAKC